MIFPRSNRVQTALGLSLLMAAGSLQAIDLEGLVKNSPFGGTAKSAEESKPGSLEFRGMYAERGVTYYSIYNATTKQSVWVKEGETADGPVPFVVKGYDADSEAVLLENGGQPVKVMLHTATVTNYTGAATALAAAPVAANTTVTGATPAGGFAFNNGQAPTPEQIQAFREEMRRRFNRNGGEGAPGGAESETRASRRERDAGATPGKTSAAPTPTKNKAPKSK